MKIPKTLLIITTTTAACPHGNHSQRSKTKPVQTSPLRSKSIQTENNLIDLKQQKDEGLKTVEDMSSERDVLREKLYEVEISVKECEDEKLELLRKVEVSQERISELMDGNRRVFSRSFDMLSSIKDCVSRVIRKVDEEKIENIIVKEAEENSEELKDLDDESKKLLIEIMFVYKMVLKAESRLMESVEKRRKEKRELENSVVSLTEENRDINSLLRIALVEKEAVEKSLSKLKGNGEQKKVALLQFAERGLQKVGFGFMMGTSPSEVMDNEGSSMCGKSESSECEEEFVSLASSFENIMKNLRLESTQLKLFLEESRSDNERLQSLAEKHAKRIAECTSYINDLEERESRLAHNIEQLMIEITEAQEEVERWREACELEVEAGKGVIDEYEKEAMILREELNKARASVGTLSNKLKLKEKLAAAAIAAQEAARKSLQVGDRRAAELHERVEELTRQLEVADNRGERNIRLKVRHICWPWRALTVNPGGPRSRNARRMLPEMQGL